ncbi:MAG: hypothetical protein NTV15_00075 [Candidatus Bathyarchaeota archaeon]|nr:hypothetical protein [Candidatus Bathyarchaeota archaeon]
MDSHINPRRLGEFLSKNARHRLTLLVLDKMKVKPVGKGVKADPRGRPRGKESVLADMLVVKQRTVHRWLDPDGVQANDSNATELAHIAVQYDFNETSKILLYDLAEHREAVNNWIIEMRDTNVRDKTEDAPASN